MSVIRICTVRLSLAFDLSHEDFCKLMDKDDFNKHDDNGDWDSQLVYKLLELDRVVEVDYHGMFVRHAIFVDLDMSVHLEQDKEDICKIIEDYIK